MGTLPRPVVFIVSLLFGWSLYLQRVIPQITINGSGVLSGALCIAGVLLIGHWLASWLWRETRPADAPKHRWKPGWTVALTSIVVLLFFSGMAAIGIVHQSVWLVRSDKPLFSRYGAASNRIMCAMNLRQIGIAIANYAQSNAGKLPDSLDELLIAGDLASAEFICPSSDLEKSPGDTPQQQAQHLHENHCSYIYIGKGLKSPSQNQPILFERPENHNFKGTNILYGDGRVDWANMKDAKQILKDYVE
jgi:prepilin-type processing-associated H-X9-DG protein